MDRYEFLRAILPPSGGNYVAFFAKSTDKNSPKWNKHCSTIEELADECVRASNQGLIAYYALGLFNNNTSVEPDGRIKAKRTAVLAEQFKTYALDIDAGKANDKMSYPTGEDALRALIDFIKATGLPVPLVVSSGNGIHAYWPLTQPVAKADWVRNGTALKALCHKHGLKIDDSKVHDPTMVLRPLDTLNKGKPVRVLHPGAGLHDPSIATKFGTAPDKSAAPKPQRTSQQDTMRSQVQANIEASLSKQYEPLIPAKLVQHCVQLKEATTASGANASYWQWYLSLGVAKYCVNPKQTAIDWCSGHPGFTEEETFHKMENEWVMPPPTCIKFDEQVPGPCRKCQHWGHIGSPATLGRPDPKPIDPVVDADHTPQVTPAHVISVDPRHTAPSIEPPAPYKRTTKGVQWENNGVWLEICSYDLFPSHIVRDPSTDTTMVEWIWQKPHVGYSRLVVKSSAIFNTSSVVDLMNTLADNGFFVEDKVKQGWLGQYMRAYTQLLQKHQASTDLYNSFGWKDNDTKFVLGSTEFRRNPDGSVSTHEVGLTKLLSTKNYDKTFTPNGSLETWIEWTRILDHPELHTHQIELARAFAAPLMPFTGLQGVLFSLAGDTGRGKSTMQNWCASVYGNPRQVNTTAQDTQMAIVQRMGVWNCLPLAVDEVTLIKPEHLANLIYWGTQGQDRNRANEVTYANQWALPLSLSTNRSLLDKARLIGLDVEALLHRILEINFPENEIFRKESAWGRRIGMALLDNYGTAGRVYIPYLLKLGAARIRADIEAKMDAIKTEYGFEFVGPERYWQVAAVLCDLGASYAKELGLIKYDYRKGTRALLNHVEAQRRYMGSTKMDIYDMVAEYMVAHNAQSVKLVYRDGVVTLPHYLPQGEIRIRKELYATAAKPKPDRGFAFIDKHHFHHWIVGKGYEFSAVFEELTQDKAAFRPGRNGRIYMGKDTGISLPQVTAFGLNLNHERLRGMLEIEEVAADNVTSITKGIKA